MKKRSKKSESDERWVVEKLHPFEDDPRYTVYDFAGHRMFDSGDPPTLRQAKQIVKRWNAYAELRKQRDALLMACKQALSALEPYEDTDLPGGYCVTAIVGNMRAAIAAAEPK